MFKHILVPTDGSELSQDTARRAVSFAKEAGACITAFYAKPEYPVTYYGEGALIDSTTPEQFAELAEQQAQSPAFNIDKIRIPVMLVQGGKDERVPPAQYRLLKNGLIQAGNPPEVDILEPKEAHGFYDFDNKVRLYTEMEAFLDRHIGPSAR